MPPVVAAIAAIAGAIASSVTVGTIVTAVVGGIVSTGLGLAAGALFKQRTPNVQGVGQRARETVENVVGTVEYVPVVYGQSRVGGLRVYCDVGKDDRKTLYQATVLCEGEIEEIVAVRVNNTGYTTQFVVPYYLLGTDSQTPPAAFYSGAPKWTQNHRLAGLAAILTRIPKNANTFPNIPVITAQVKGKLVYDPRTGTTAYSTNPALCIRDYLTNTRYGKGLAAAELDDDSFIDAANYCDQLVSNSTGGTQKRYECNGILLTRQTIQQNLDELLTSCNGTVAFTGGKYRLIILKPEVATFTFDQSVIIGGFQIKYEGKRFKFNRVEAEYINPGKNWQPDIAIYEDADWLAIDGEPLTTKIELPYTTNRDTAIQIAQIALRQSRLDKKVEFRANLAALQVNVGDVVNITHPVPGWTDVKFRVVGLTLEPQGEVVVSCEEYDDDVYVLGDIDPEELGESSDFESPAIVQAPSGLTVSQTFITNSLGEELNRITLAWTEPDSAFVVEYQAEYKLAADSTWTIVGRTPEPSININDIAAGTYDFQVKAINSLNIASEYVSTQATVVNNTDRPADVTGFQAVLANGSVHLTWDRVPGAYSGGSYRIKHVGKTTGAIWSDPPNLDFTVPGKQESVSLGQLDGTYLIKARNIAGIESAQAASYVLDLPDSEEWQAVVTSQEDAQFPGLKVNTEVSAGVLRLTSTQAGADGPRFGSAVTTVAGGNFVTWSGTGNIYSSDDTYATVTTTFGGNVSDSLRPTGFNCQVPTNATVVGIEVLIERRSSSTSATDNWTDTSIRLVKAGTVVGDNKSTAAVWTNTTDAEFTYGGAADLWGTTWTPAEVNASDFGVSLQLRKIGSTSRTASVDCIRVRVYFTPAGSGDVLSGEYYFRNTVDLGGVYLTRLKRQWTGLYTSTTGVIADVPNFRAIPNVGALSAGNTSVGTLYYRTTRDNPSSSPTWSDWTPLNVADVAARGIQFKQVITREDTAHNLEISQLRALVQLRRRVVAGSVAAAAGGSTVTYGRAFYATPNLTTSIGNPATGDYETASNQTRSAFDIIARNSGGTGVARTINYVATGNGEQIA